MKNNKGITLTVLIITIILILIIAGTVGYYTNSGFELQGLNNMYSDIEQLQNKVDDYYLENGTLPLKLNNNENDNIAFTITDRNINDNNLEYYVIDLSKLENLKLNYGNDFENIKNGTNMQTEVQTYNDVYIINATSQTIYYLRGIEYKNSRNYSLPTNYANITE